MCACCCGAWLLCGVIAVVRVAVGCDCYTVACAAEMYDCCVAVAKRVRVALRVIAEVRMAVER